MVQRKTADSEYDNVELRKKGGHNPSYPLLDVLRGYAP